MREESRLNLLSRRRRLSDTLYNSILNYYLVSEEYYYNLVYYSYYIKK